jgi:hypothetical protein
VYIVKKKNPTRLCHGTESLIGKKEINISRQMYCYKPSLMQQGAVHCFRHGKIGPLIYIGGIGEVILKENSLPKAGS